MNNVELIGRLTKDITCEYGSKSQKAFARFTIAINRGKDRDGNDLGADFPTIIAFGRQAENCERMLKKGALVGITGEIRTGKYEDKNGRTVFTTEVYSRKIDFLEHPKKEEKPEVPSNFESIDDIDF